MKSITVKDLEQMVRIINTRLGLPLEPYTMIDGKYTPNAGVYCLGSAYGGYCLERMCDTGTGVHTVLPGFVPKRELYQKLSAFIAGMEAK